MKQTIYIDILICVNLFINYLILLAVSRFMNIKTKLYRTLIGAMIGAAASLIILLPQLGGLVNIVIKIILSFIIVAAVYGIKDFKLTLKLICVFFLMTFVFCGAMLALWYIAYPKGLTMRNSVVYINISPQILIVFTVICYLIIRVIGRITGKSSDYKLYNKVRINVNGQTALLNAKLDTGNSLKEPFSGLPVIIVNDNILKNLPKADSEGVDVEEYFALKARLIPFSSLGGNGILPAVKANEVYVNEKRFQGECFVALCQKGILPEGVDALIGSELID